MNKRLLGFFLVAISLMLPAFITAQPGVCHDDAVKLCKGDVGGKQKMITCLSQHLDEVTPACKTHIMTVREKGKKFAGNCRTDRMKFCKDVKPGQGRIASCLMEHSAELSPACRKQFN